MNLHSKLCFKVSSSVFFSLYLLALSLDFIGKHHSGIDDCHSIIQVVKALINRGHTFDEPTSVIDIGQYDPAFVGFSPVAPLGSWVCIPCTTMHRKDHDSPESAVWNKPLAKVCRFCLVPQTE
jgi:hypothetical protein